MLMEKVLNQDRENRRLKTRFPIHRELRYRLMQDGRVLEMGIGKTVNMASNGVAFALDRALTAGAFIELSISWPVLLDSGTPVRLVVFGRVLRNVGRLSACTVDRYEFRTQARSFARATVRQDSMLERWADAWTKETAKMQAAV